MKDVYHYISLLGEFANKHAKQHGIERIGIFGSVARGEQQKDSDIDVYYEGKPQSLTDPFDLCYELEKLFGTKIDLVRKHPNMNKHLQERISKEVIYA
ncbi:hypothetical protein R83H12_02152 [Fibrobacteria bacterium R8-3-H12]